MSLTDQNMPEMSSSRLSDEESHSSADYRCPICSDTEDLHDYSVCSCLHTFHHQCLQIWVNGGNMTCPMCRAVITREDAARMKITIIAPIAQPLMSAEQLAQLNASIHELSVALTAYQAVVATPRCSRKKLSIFTILAVFGIIVDMMFIVLVYKNYNNPCSTGGVWDYTVPKCQNWNGQNGTVLPRECTCFVNTTADFCKYACNAARMRAYQAQGGDKTVVTVGGFGLLCVIFVLFTQVAALWWNVADLTMTTRPAVHRFFRINSGVVSVFILCLVVVLCLVQSITEKGNYFLSAYFVATIGLVGLIEICAFVVVIGTTWFFYWGGLME